eukprot:gene20322-31280_t
MSRSADAFDAPEMDPGSLRGLSEGELTETLLSWHYENQRLQREREFERDRLLDELLLRRRCEGEMVYHGPSDSHQMNSDSYINPSDGRRNVRDNLHASPHRCQRGSGGRACEACEVMAKDKEERLAQLRSRKATSARKDHRNARARSQSPRPARGTNRRRVQTADDEAQFLRDTYPFYYSDPESSSLHPNQAHHCRYGSRGRVESEICLYQNPASYDMPRGGACRRPNHEERREDDNAMEAGDEYLYSSNIRRGQSRFGNMYEDMPQDPRYGMHVRERDGGGVDYPYDRNMERGQTRYGYDVPQGDPQRAAGDERRDGFDYGEMRYGNPRYATKHPSRDQEGDHLRHRNTRRDTSYDGPDDEEYAHRAARKQPRGNWRDDVDGKEHRYIAGARDRFDPVEMRFRGSPSEVYTAQEHPGYDYYADEVPDHYDSGRTRQGRITDDVEAARQRKPDAMQLNTEEPVSARVSDWVSQQDPQPEKNQAKTASAGQPRPAPFSLSQSGHTQPQSPIPQPMPEIHSGAGKTHTIVTAPPIF